MAEGAFDEPDPPAGGAGWVDSAVYPLCVQVPEGWWRIFPLAAAGEHGREFVAQLVTDSAGPGSDGPVAIALRAASVWGLEEALGWPLPLAGHITLHAATPWAALGRHRARYPGATRPVGLRLATSTSLPDEGRGPGLRPGRAGLVLRAGHAPATYGRLRHAEGPARAWEHAGCRVEIVRAVPRPPTAAGGHRLTYRLAYREVVVFAGDDAPLAHGYTPYSTDAIRAAVTAVTTDRARGPLSDQQQTFLTVHGPALAAAAQPVEDPYPRGTRIEVVDPGLATSTTGTVLDSRRDEDGQLDYVWRPDVAALPGHPWRAQPGRALRDSSQYVTATLDVPDTHTDTLNGEPAIMATGAVVATIDDPRFTVGTVLRTYAGDGPTPRYEIQPHDAPTGPVVVGATDVTPLAGTAWTTVTDLLLARAAADLDLRPFELLLAVRDFALAADGPNGPHLAVTSALPEADVALDPDGRAVPVTVPPDPETPTPPPARPIPIGSEQGASRLEHPVYGPIAVDAQLLAQALAAGPATITDVLNRRPWLPPGPHPPLVAAYLAAKHAPADLTALTQPTQPRPDTPSTGPPDADITPPASPGQGPSTDPPAGRGRDVAAAPTGRHPQIRRCYLRQPPAPAHRAGPAGATGPVASAGAGAGRLPAAPDGRPTRRSHRRREWHPDRRLHYLA